MNNDYYVYERGTTSGGTLYEPMHRHADPNGIQTNPSFNTREEAERWIALNTDRVYAFYRHSNPASLGEADIFIGFITEHGMWESMQQHGLRFSELRDHIKDVKAGAVVCSDDGYEWRLAEGAAR